LARDESDDLFISGLLIVTVYIHGPLRRPGTASVRGFLIVTVYIHGPPKRPGTVNIHGPPNRPGTVNIGVRMMMGVASVRGLQDPAVPARAKTAWLPAA